MYPEELQEYIKHRNYYIGGDDLSFVTDIKEHPQLNHIMYDDYTKTYKMWDVYGNYYEFKAMSYEEAKQKNLVKRR